jgi:hypothetical protein
MLIRRDILPTRGVESPLTPLTKGEREQGVGDSVCGKASLSAPSELKHCTLIRYEGGGRVYFGWAAGWVAAPCVKQGEESPGFTGGCAG